MYLYSCLGWGKGYLYLFGMHSMLNPRKHSNRNKAIIQFWRLSIHNQGKRNIDKCVSKPSLVFTDEASNLFFQPSSHP